MKRALALAVLAGACAAPREDVQPRPRPVRETVTVTAKVVRVTKFASARLGFDFYLGRPASRLSQEPFDDGKRSPDDLPEAIRAHSLEIHTPDRRYSGAACRAICACQLDALPHTCREIPLADVEVQDRPTSTFLLDVGFADGAGGTVSLDVPNPPSLDAPAIIEPSVAPRQGDALRLSFIDVGADVYEVRVSLCREYGNDGINPCLDGRQYLLMRRNGVLGAYDWGGVKLSEARVRVVQGAVTLESSQRLRYAVRVSYNIVGKRRSRGADGIELATENAAERSFERAAGVEAQ